jgi:hypothetical protein
MGKQVRQIQEKEDKDQNEHGDNRGIKKRGNDA